MTVAEGREQRGVCRYRGKPVAGVTHATRGSSSSRALRSRNGEGNLQCCARDDSRVSRIDVVPYERWSGSAMNTMFRAAEVSDPQDLHES